MIDWDDVRNLFPAVKNATYLNTAGGGPMCARVAEPAKAYYDDTVASGDAKWDEWLERVDETRRHLASQIGAAPEEIAFLSNASQGLNLLAAMFDSRGDVLAMGDDFPSVTLPWIHRGYSVHFAPSRPDGTIPLKTLEEAFRPEVKLLAAGHVQYRTGFRFDLMELGEFCRARGMALVLDVTQSFGVFPIDVSRSDIDALVFSGYKWIGAGYGIAPLYVRKETLEARGLPAVGWRSTKKPYDLTNDLLDLTGEARGFELGHPPFPGIFALDGALQLIDEISIERIEARVQELTEHLHARMNEADIPIRSPRAQKHRSGITMVGVDNPAVVAQKLKERNVFTSARGESLRVSLHFYNNHDDIHRFASALTDIFSEQ